MLQTEKIAAAMKAVDECCGHCEVCSPVCPVAIARRSLMGLYYDMLAAEATQPSAEEA